MLREPHPKIISAVNRLNAHEDFRVFLQYLTDELAEADRHNRQLIGENLFRSQGKSLTLDAILSLAKDAPKKISTVK